MDLPFKPHFTITCSCGVSCASGHSFSPEELKKAETDLVIALRILPADDQQALVRFFDEHRRLGHSPEPRLVGFAPLPTA